MVKIISLPATGGRGTGGRPPQVIRSAQDAARRYDHCVEAYWRGEEDGCAFCDAFADFWRPAVAHVKGPPIAESPLGAGGRGLDWREADGVVIGNVRGGVSGYQIPVGAMLPELATPPQPMRAFGHEAASCGKG